MNNSTGVPNKLSAAVLFSHIEMSAAMPSLMSREGGGRLTRGGLVFGRPRSACVCLSVCMFDSKRRFLLFGPDTCAASFHELVNNKLLLVIVIWCLSGDHFWTPDMRFCIARSRLHIWCAKQHKQLYIFIRVFWLSK